MWLKYSLDEDVSLQGMNDVVYLIWKAQHARRLAGGRGEVSSSVEVMDRGQPQIA